MKKVTKSVLFCGILLCQTGFMVASFANDDLKHRHILAKEANAVLQLGAGVSIKRPAYQADNQVSVVPLAFYDNNVWYVEGIEAGVYPYKDSKNHVRLGLSYDGRTLNTQDSQALTLANERQFSVLAHASYLHITKFGGIRTKLATDILGKHKGVTASVAHISRFNFSDTVVYPSFGVTWHSQDYNNYYYGITTDESTRSGLANYTADAGVSPFVSLTANHDLTDKTALFGNVRIDWLSDSQKKSPLTTGDTESTITIGAMYRFK